MITRSVLAVIAGIVLGAGSSLAYKLAVSAKQSNSTRLESSTSAWELPRCKQPFLRAELNKRYDHYLEQRSRHHRILLDEVISAYMRAEPEECLALLRSLNALCLVSPDRMETLIPEDLNDFGRALQIASSMSGKRGDALICTAFRRKIADDPAQAFELLGSLPKYLVEDLSSELAVKWGTRDGRKAAEAFLKCSVVSSWKTQFSEAMRGWAGRDPEAAFRFLEQTPLLAAPLNREQFLHSLALGYPREAAKVLTMNGPLAGTLFSSLLQVDPQEALKLAANAPGAYGRNWQLQGAASHLINKDPSLALKTALQTPNSERSLFLIREAARQLGSVSSEGSFALAEEQQDSYQRTAAFAGVTEGLYRSKNLDGVAEVVRQGVSSNNAEWLESASSLILNGPQRNMSFLEYSMRLDQYDEGNNNTVISVPGSEKQQLPDWKALTPDVRTALIQYAEKNWPAAKVNALKKKLQ